MTQAMKLSEAIRLGSMMKPQRVGSFGGDGKSCALRAAADAVGIQDAVDPILHRTLNYNAIERQWPFLAEDHKCPLCPQVHHNNGNGLVVIYSLNDSHGWTREQIADWVETIEPAEVESPEPASVRVERL